MAEATTTITVRIPIEIRDRLDRLAGHTRRSRSYLAVEALEIYTRFELEIVEQILEGIEDMKAGRVIPHEEAVAELRGRIDKVAAKSKRLRA